MLCVIWLVDRGEGFEYSVIVIMSVLFVDYGQLLCNHCNFEDPVRLSLLFWNLLTHRHIQK